MLERRGFEHDPEAPWIRWNARRLDELDDYAVSGDGARLVVSDHGALSVRPADKHDDAEPENVDLSRIRITIQPQAEREPDDTRSSSGICNHFQFSGPVRPMPPCADPMM